MSKHDRDCEVIHNTSGNACGCELRARLEEAERANAELNVEISRLYACRNELQDCTRAMDDPAVNNTRTLNDAIHALKRDAARYRWLRGWVDRDVDTSSIIPMTGTFQNTCLSGVELDAAIDAAMERQP